MKFFLNQKQNKQTNKKDVKIALIVGKKRKTRPGVKEFFDCREEANGILLCKFCGIEKEEAKVEVYSNGSLLPLKNHLKSAHLYDLRNNNLHIFASQTAWDELIRLQKECLGERLAEKTQNLPEPGCEFIEIGENTLRMDQIAPEPDRVNWYGAFVAGIAKGFPIVRMNEFISLMPDSDKYPTPSTTIVTWVVLFGELFFFKIKRTSERGESDVDHRWMESSYWWNGR